MNDTLVIAAVSAGLERLLREAARAVPGATVSREPRGGTVHSAGILLHLVDLVSAAPVSPHAAAPRGPDGRLNMAHQARFDLRYRLLFSGDVDRFEPERLLGQTVALLTARAQLPGSLIQAAVDQLPDPQTRALMQSFERGTGPSLRLVWGELAGGATPPLGAPPAPPGMPALMVTVAGVPMRVDAASIHQLEPEPMPPVQPA